MNVAIGKLKYYLQFASTDNVDIYCKHYICKIFHCSSEFHSSEESDHENETNINNEEFVEHPFSCDYDIPVISNSLWNQSDRGL